MLTAHPLPQGRSMPQLFSSPQVLQFRSKIAIARVARPSCRKDHIHGSLDLMKTTKPLQKPAIRHSEIGARYWEGYWKRTGRDDGKKHALSNWEIIVLECEFQTIMGQKNGCKQHLHSNYSPGQFTQSDWQDFQLMGKDGIPIPVLRFSYLNGPGSKQIVSNKGLYGCMPFFRAQLKMILTYTIDQLKSPILHVV